MIIAKNLSIDFPIYGTKSFKNKMITSFTGGVVKMAEKNVIVTALQDLTFQFKDGERIGLWGHNGSGKTTLLRVLAGVYQPTRGTLQVNGKIASLLNISLGTEYDASGIDNIYLRAALMGLSKKETKSIMDDVIDFADIGDFIYLPLKTYSSGMQMRLNFAVATAIKSDIVLMDEWLSVGDADFSKKAQIRLMAMLDCSKLMVIASHNKEMLRQNCTRIISLEHGRIINDETV